MKSVLRNLFRPPAGKMPAPRRRRRLDLGPKNPAYSLYAIGDVHGRLDAVLEAEARIQEDTRRIGRPGLIIFLGDYVDRGPQSSAVVEHFCANRNSKLRRLTLCGNHDDTLLNFIEDFEDAKAWLEFGGRETLLSYGIDADHILKMSDGPASLSRAVEYAIPPHHRRFLENLPISLRIGDFFFVHAGVRPHTPLDLQSDQDMMWIREPFLTEGPCLPVTVVHGHTITEEPVFENGRIGIDTAAYRSGKLAVLRILQGKAEVL